MSSEPGSASRAQRFRHLRELGRGGMGTVDLVYDEMRAVPVARKRMHQLTSETRFRIKQEFRQVQEIRHPSLVRLYDLFADDDDAFFTMEVVDGVDLSQEVAGAVERLGRDSREVATLVEDRLRQLAEAVIALHDAGVVHRDIKPSNVLVDASGRVVLLDFGFSSALSSEQSESEDRMLVGTVPYMAPECLWGGQPSASSDWYSVGVIAAELWLGRTLFAGSLQAIIRSKDRPPASLLAQTMGLSAPLDELICGWLRREPHKRPADPSLIRQVLGAAQPARAFSSNSGIVALFVGRERELAQLEHSIPLEARAQVIRIEGQSGIGKSALMRELGRRLKQRPGWVVLRGRCHPREQLALKALDSLMDEVSRHLKALGPRACAKIAAIDGMPALIDMFPVLARVPELSSIDTRSDEGDPQARWIDGLRAFRALWFALAASDHVAVFIDDLQWADKDGLKLLYELIAIEPRPRIVWVLSYRSTPLSRSAELDLVGSDAPEGSFTLQVGGLAREDATELAIRFGASSALASSIEREAGGSPFIISELARSVSSEGELASVEAVLEERLRALEQHELAALEHLSLAAGPLSVETMTSLVAEGVPVAAVLDRLENGSLLRLSYDGNGDEQAEAYHDRIREAVSLRMSDEARRAAHLRLALALRARLPNAKRAAIAFHYREADATGECLAMTLEAAGECTRALAFEQAAELYEQAIALHPQPIPVEVIEGAASSLALAGQCETAARRYLDAAAAAESPPYRRALQLQAGAHFLYAGRIHDGRKQLESVLRQQRLGWPRWPLLSSLWLRLRVLVGSQEIELKSRPVDPTLAERFDTLSAIARGTVMVEPPAGDVLALRAVHVARRLGDASRLIWALGHEAASQANIGGARLQTSSSALFARVRGMVEQSTKPLDHAYLRLVEGTMSYFKGEWPRSERALRDARRMYRQLRTEVLHEQNVAAAFLVSAFEQQGDVASLDLLLADLRTVAQHTGNLYASFLFRTGAAGLSTLAKDDPEHAIAEADAALEAWPMKQFTAQHHYHFQTTLWARLYAGRADEAWQQVERTWPQLRAAHYLRIECVGAQHRHLRARAALLAGEAATPDRARVLLREAEREAAAIRKSQLPPAAPLCATIEYGLATFAGRWDVARERCEAALMGFDRANMALCREVARLRLSSLSHEPEQRRNLDAQARAWFAGAGIRNPEAMARSLMPGRASAP